MWNSGGYFTIVYKVLFKSVGAKTPSATQKIFDKNKKNASYPERFSPQKQLNKYLER